jgi:hypothetical protein
MAGYRPFTKAGLAPAFRLFSGTTAGGIRAQKIPGTLV